MNKVISGASNVTEYQLVKFSQSNKVYQDDILSLYIKYALQFGIQVDVAYCLCLVYTNFFQKEIKGNNIIGIGTQKGGTKLETFASVEDCIIAEYEILQKVSSTVSCENPHSNLYRRVESNSCLTSTESYFLFDYDELTSYSVYEFSRFIREINRTRKDDPGWANGSSFYYFIRIASDKNKNELIRKRSDLINKKFDPKTLFITADNGVYTLEAGRYTSPINTNNLLKNLRLFGYDGEVDFRRSSII